MTETVTYFEPKELSLVRLECLTCNCVIELPVGKSLGVVSVGGSCKNCNADIADDAVLTALDSLAKALKTLSLDSKKFHLDIVVKPNTKD